MAKTLSLPVILASLASLFLAAAPLQAFDEEQEPAGGFTYGASCGQLSQYQHREILALVHSVHSEHYARFCSPEGIYSCDDYSALLSGAGIFEENGSSGCRFVPE